MDIPTKVLLSQDKLIGNNLGTFLKQEKAKY